MCLIELRAVKEFVRIIASARLSEIRKSVCYKNCNVFD